MTALDRRSRRIVTLATLVALAFVLSGCASKTDDGPSGDTSEAVTPFACAASKCLIGGVCYNNGTLNPLNECQSCNKDVSTTAWSNLSNATSCTSDGVSCTTDACNG